MTENKLTPKRRDNRGRRPLPAPEKKVPVTIFVKQKHEKEFLKDVNKLLDEKYAI